MKRIKIASLALACCFALFASFKNKQPTESPAKATLLFKWFEYNGWGDPYDPDSYTQLSSSPECHGDGNLCSVYALTDLFGGRPSALSLLDLGLSSCSFTQSYIGLLGKVSLTHE